MVLQAFCKGNAEGQSMLIATIVPVGNHGLEGSGARQATRHPLLMREHYSLPVTEASVWAACGRVDGLPCKCTSRSCTASALTRLDLSPAGLFTPCRL